jgi:hypothetical protein
MISSRNLCILSIGLSFYMVGQVFDLPAINIPFSLFVVGVFLGILRKPYNYYLYLVTVLAELPNIFVTYGKMILTLDAEINTMFGVGMLISKQAITNEKIIQTYPWWEPIFIIIFVTLTGWLLLDIIKEIIKNARLFFIISSYPIFAFTFNFIFTWFYLMYNIPSLAIKINTLLTPEALIEVITPWYRNMIISQRIIMDITCIIFAPLYAYLVARELKIYKRLGIGK